MPEINLNLTADQLVELEELAASLMSKRDIATIMQLDPCAFNHALEHQQEVSEAYRRGYLRTKAAVRKSVVALASQGSSPAQNMAAAFMNEIENDKSWWHEQ